MRGVKDGRVGGRMGWVEKDGRAPISTLYGVLGSIPGTLPFVRSMFITHIFLPITLFGMLFGMHGMCIDQ